MKYQIATFTYELQVNNFLATLPMEDVVDIKVTDRSYVVIYVQATKEEPKDEGFVEYLKNKEEEVLK